MHTAKSPQQKGLFAFFKRHLISTVFIFGFAFDIFVLPDVDHFLTIILGTSYITLFSICLFFRELLIKNNKVDDEERETYRLLTFLISFFSGSSLSYIFTYSLRSADIGLSAPFLFIFFSILILNELINSHKFRLLFDYVLLVISSSFYLIYMMPLITGYFDDTTLYIGIFSSTAFIYLYTALFSHHSEFADMIKPKGNALAFSLPLVILFLALNFLLPPVPFKVEKISVTSSGFIQEKDKNFIAKLLSLDEDESFTVKYDENANLSYMTIYSLPEGVVSSPEHFWYKKGVSSEYELVVIVEKKENTQFDIRSLETKIKEEKGEYKVITKVGRRVVREDIIYIR